MSNKMKSDTSEIGEKDELLHARPTGQTGAPDVAVFDHAGSGGRTDSASCQAPDMKASAPPTPDEVKDRLRRARRSGPHRPLARLAQTEAELQTRSAALARLSSPQQRRSDKNLLVHQLVRTVDTRYLPRTLAPELRNDIVGLYSALQSEDPIDSVFDRLIVGALNNVMACHARAAEAGRPQAIDINLRHAERGSKVIIELVEARERRRNPKQIVVRKVSVEAGGQAIVGNVKTSRDQTPADTEDQVLPPLRQRPNDS